MLKNLKSFIYRCGSILRLPYIAHRVLFRNQISILMYHAVIDSPLEVSDWCFLESQRFRKQVMYLEKYFDILPLSEAVIRCQNGQIRRPTAVVTFDDGYQNNFDCAFPVLQELGIPATIFLNTDYIDTDKTIWFCRLNKALTDTYKTSFEWVGQSYDISDLRKRAMTSAALQARFKEYPHSLLIQNLNALLAELEVAEKYTIPADSPFRILDTKSIEAMSKSGLIEFGAHTHSHTILSLLPRQEQSGQITRSIKKVEELTGEVCVSFSYPNGRAEDFDSDTIALLKECGIRYAVTTIPGGNGRKTPCLELRRYGIGADSSMDYFQALIHHCSFPYRPWGVVQ